MWNLFAVGSLQFPNDSTIASLEANQNRLSEFDIDTEKLMKEINKRKSWTTPGIDGVQHFWWKKLVASQKTLLNAFKRIISDNSMIPGWLRTGRIVLLAKTKDPSNEKNYQLITCLNTSY